MDMSIIGVLGMQGVGNNMKFHRLPLKLFLKDEILPEICAVLKDEI